MNTSLLSRYTKRLILHGRWGVALIAFLTSVVSVPAQVAQPITWVQATSAALARSEAEGIGIGNKLYVISGFYGNGLNVTVNCEMYDASTNVWSPIADIPEPITHSGAAEDGAWLYVAGGYVGTHPGPITDHVWRYHIPTNTWSAFVPLPAARGAGMVVRLGRELHFFGGAVRLNGIVQYDAPDHWALNLDATAPAWIARAPLPVPTNHLGGAALNGKLYAVGGQFLDNESFGNQAAMWEYDPTTNAWTAKATMPRGLGHISNSTFALNNRIVAVGGRLNGNIISAYMVEYSPATNSWRDLTFLPTSLLAPVAAVVDGRLTVNGGHDGFSPHLATNWRSGAVLSTAATAATRAGLVLWPNPALNQSITIEVNTPTAGNCQVQVTDALGRVPQSFEWNKPSGKAQYSLAAGLRPGFYTVAVRQGAYYDMQKLIIE